MICKPKFLPLQERRWHYEQDVTHKVVNPRQKFASDDDIALVAAA
jgi:hypothetical protein